eukprot:TRINITY_DN7662_c0_g1_i7.p2 TRINITY_DN7662_c0_g1~~TRINITY_DN7662_c0_g1_i7.p2  ORF type:complete len:210 (+),score=23.09 TRINITY_DN7662_c0_g1_i7:287-916(+)
MPTSKWLGDAPKYSMGTSQRGNLGKSSRNPGPDVYTLNSSVGQQVESFKNTSPSISIGTEGRGRGGSKQNPVYSDTLYNSVSSISNQRLSQSRTFPHTKIGTSSRFRQASAEQGPGPGNYKTKSSIGRQVESSNKSGGSRTFGVRHSGKASALGASTMTPGPAGYNLRDSLGRQVNSINRSSAKFSMSTASRFKSAALNSSPGPGAYTV